MYDFTNFPGFTLGDVLAHKVARQERQDPDEDIDDNFDAAAEAVDPGVRREAGLTTDDRRCHWIEVALGLEKQAPRTTGFDRDWLNAQAAGYRAVAKLEGSLVTYEVSGGIPGSATRTYLMEGLCGFAWLHTKGNTAFGRWAKKHGWTKAYPTGIQYWIGHFNQSFERKEAWAHGTARYLREQGHDVWSGSRLD